MQVDQEPEQQEAADEAVEEERDAAGEEQPATASKKQKPKAAKAATPAAPAATGRAKRERKSVEFFVPEVPNREKKAEKPKEVGVSLHDPCASTAVAAVGGVLSPLCCVRVCDDTGRGREDWRHPQQ